MNIALEEISNALGAERLSAIDDDRRLFFQDISASCEGQVDAVVRPVSTQQLAEAVRIAWEHGLSVYPRGGGMSYTSGYISRSPNGVGLDLSGLDGIEEVDTVGCTVTVQCGCTWSSLYDALSEKGWRTPFLGPLSGISATIGGSLSQNASFFGSASAGYAADSLLGVEIVDGTGRLHRMGSWGAGRQPGLRYFGPDLVGPFIGDCGAFGIKTRAVLRIEPVSPAAHYLAYAFDRSEDLIAAMRDLSQVPHLSEVWALDSQAHANLSQSGFSTLETVSIASEIAGGSRSVVDAVRNLASASRLRSVTLKDLAWSLNIVVEPPLPELMPAVVETVQRIAATRQGTAIPDTIPRVTRAKPFRRIKALVGPNGERWLPCHGIAPAGTALAVLQGVSANLEKRRNEMRENGIVASVLLAAAGREIIVEPQLFWPDSLSAFQRSHASDSQIAAYADRPDNPEVRALAMVIREELTRLLARAGCSHLQIGRHYSYAEDLDDGMRLMARSIKQAFDPKGILNPGVLGLPLPD